MPPSAEQLLLFLLDEPSGAPLLLTSCTQGFPFAGTVLKDRPGGHSASENGAAQPDACATALDPAARGVDEVVVQKLV